MLMMRLQRVGRKHDPSYRIVVTEKTRGPKSVDYVELVGSYDARKDKDVAVTFNEERAKYWLSVGVTPSDTVYNLLISKGLLEGKKRPMHASKNWGEPKKEEEPEASAEEAKVDDAPVEEKPAEAPKAEEKTEEVKEEEKKEEPKAE